MKTLFWMILFAGAVTLLVGFFVKPIEDSAFVNFENEVIVNTAVDSEVEQQADMVLEKTPVEIQPEPEITDPLSWNTLTSSIVSEKIAFSTYLQTIVENNVISMIGDSDGERWWITVLNEEILPEDSGQQRRLGNAPYGRSILTLTIMSTEEFLTYIKTEQQTRLQSNLMNLPVPGEIGEIVLFGTAWNWFDFEDAYDGGFMRTYFREENGYVISFRLSDEIVTSQPDISKLQSVQFLKIEE